jgi:pimeloyl-ACP methyl ester carboxylesterase
MLRALMARSSLDAARADAGALSVRLSDGTTAYHVHGSEGPWVVMVHGLITPGDAWRPLAEGMARQGFRVLHYDQFGRGLSDRPALRYDLALYARQLRELMDAVGIAGAHHVSWSMGGLVSSQVALDEPERVHRLAMIAPGFFVPAPAAVRLVSKLPFADRIIARRLGATMRALPAEHLAEPGRFPLYGQRLREQEQHAGVRESFASTVMNYRWNAGPEFQPVGAHPRRVLLVWGDDDPSTPYRNAARVCQVFPRAELITLRGARHAPHLEHRDEIEAALVRFLHSDAPAMRARAIS